MYCRIVLIVIFSASQSAFGTFVEISLSQQTELGKLVFGLKSPINLLFLIKTVMVISSMVLEFMVKHDFILSGEFLKKSPKEFRDEYFRHRLG